MREQQQTASSCSNSWPTQRKASGERVLKPLADKKRKNGERALKPLADKTHNKKGSERLLKPPAEIRSKKEHKIRTEIGKVSKALGINGQGP